MHPLPLEYPQSFRYRGVPTYFYHLSSAFFMVLFHRSSALVIAIGTMLSGCATVYAPSVPHTPVLERGQVELSAGMGRMSGVEAKAAWSPLPHLLLTGELSAIPNDAESSSTNTQGATTSDNQQQASIGMGYYHAPTAASPIYQAVIGGMGWGQRSFSSFEGFVSSPYIPIPLPTSSALYETRYRRYYGQWYLAYPLSKKGLLGGLSFRSVWLDYSRLTYGGYPIQGNSSVFLEPSFFLRCGKGWLRYYAAGGVSLPVGSISTDQMGKQLGAVSYMLGGGIIFRPDLFLHRKKQVSL